MTSPKPSLKSLLFPHRKPSPGHWGFKALGALVMAGIGEFCMAQTGNSPAFWTGLFFYVVSLALLFQALPWSPRGMTATDRPLPLRLEAFLLALIALLAVFFRVYKTNQFPDGVFADRAEVALGGLRILHDHWRPFLEGLDQHVPEVCIYYLAALWIKLFGPSPSVFSYFDATLSILGVLAFYGVFRLWVKAPTALLAFFSWRSCVGISCSATRSFTNARPSSSWPRP